MSVGSQHLVQVVYFSDRAEGASDGASAELLLRMDREHIKRDITGFLFAMGGSYVSVLEGGHDVVLERMEQIAADPGHQRMVVLREGSIETRKFASWKSGDVLGKAESDYDRAEARAFASRLSKGLRVA